eukprot:jgi/Bigna1/83233/fgenesh1_pg.104_\
MTTNYDHIKGVIKAAKIRWLTVQESVDILANYTEHGFPLSYQPAQRPSPSGSVFLYDGRTAPDWYEDGYRWKNSGPGDFTSIKVNGIGSLSCAENLHTLGFRRRGYWLAQRPHIILVHYLSASSVASNSDSTDFSAEDHHRQQQQQQRLGATATTRSRFDNNSSQQQQPNFHQIEGMRMTGHRSMQQQQQGTSNGMMMQRVGGVGVGGGAGAMGGGVYDGGIGGGAGAMGGAAASSNTAFIMSGMAGRGGSGPGGGDTKINMHEDKNAKRKARKAEVARACRRRKKAYIQSLEEKASLLQQKLQTMAKSQNGEASHRKDQHQLVQLIRNAINDGQQDREIQQLIQRFVGNSRKRQRTDSNSSIQNLVRAVSPGDEAKFCLWSLDQASSSLRVGEGGLYGNLINQKLKLSPQQEFVVQGDGGYWKAAQLDRGSFGRQAPSSRSMPEGTYYLLSPKQAATLVTWLQDNPQSMKPVLADWNSVVAAAVKTTPPNNHQAASISTTNMAEHQSNEEKGNSAATSGGGFAGLNPLNLTPNLGPLSSSEDADLSAIGDMPGGTSTNFPLVFPPNESSL